MSIIKKIEKECLLGRGGASFPVHLKWKAVSSKKSAEKYLVINGAEGEPGIYKDVYIIKNHLKEFSEGVKITADFINAKKIFFYLNRAYFKLYKNEIIKTFNKVGLKSRFEIIEKPKDANYIGGEESTILNIIENKHLEPRLKPPFPTESGLFSKPTLIHNVETLYNIYLLDSGKYENKRFYSINFDKKNKGVYFLSSEMSIKDILKETKNYPNYNFFVQVGGDASGEVLNQDQLDQKVSGAGSITIYNLKKHKALDLLNYWFSFFADNSCGKCTPCREGTYRLLELFNNNCKNLKSIKDCKIDQNQDFIDLCDNLYQASFCALGSSAPIAVLSYFKNVLKKYE